MVKTIPNADLDHDVHAPIPEGAEYIPPVDHDAYDEHENDMYFIGDSDISEGEN